MSKKRKRRARRKIHSWKKLRQFLLAFGMAGIAIGVGLCIFYGTQGNMVLLGVGIAYVLVSLSVLGARGILIYLDEARKQSRRAQGSA